ncbi:MAG: hypothetical protein ACYTF9_03605 [Planctomycetota bacterium]|jgi:hypothetical protein
MNVRSSCVATALSAVATCTVPAAAQVLLIPDSSGDKVWAFDPFDGSVLSEDYIPSDGNMIQPINAVDSGTGTILVSDENADAVLEYGQDGQFIGVVADAADGLDALQGLTVYKGEIYVGSRVTDVIYRISLDGSSVEVWADEGVGTPRDQVFRADDVITSNSNSQADGGENLERFALDGTFLGTFHDSDGETGIDFPQQIQLLPDGGILAAGFTAPRGLYVYDADGNQTAAFGDIITSPRGVYVLGNGQYLYSGGTRVMRFDPATNTEDTVVNQSGRSFRYIEFSEAPGPPPLCPADTNDSGAVDVEDLVAVILSWGTNDLAADVNYDGTVDVEDLVAVILAWGACP